MNNTVTLSSNTATTDSSGVATLSSTWTPTAVGTYTLTTSYVLADNTIKTSITTIIINRKSPTVSMQILPNSPSAYGTSVTIKI